MTHNDDDLPIAPEVPLVGTGGSPWIRELYEEFAAVRDEATAYDEAEINRAIDDAVRAVRARKA